MGSAEPSTLSSSPKLLPSSTISIRHRSSLVVRRSNNLDLKRSPLPACVVFVGLKFMMLIYQKLVFVINVVAQVTTRKIIPCRHYKGLDSRLCFSYNISPNTRLASQLSPSVY
ncbi:unnamed protein product [Victoria cruziana]